MAAGLCVAPLAQALPKSSRGRVTIYRLSTRGRRASSAIRIRNANLRFKNLGTAGQYRLRPGDSSRIVPINVSVETFQLWFAKGVHVVDLRRIRVGRAAPARTAANVAPGALRLENRPNPFQASTNITFALSREGPVSLEVFDPLGRMVAVLLNGEPTSPGHHSVEFSRPGLPNGIYWARLRTLEGTVTRQMLAVH